MAGEFRPGDVLVCREAFGPGVNDPDESHPEDLDVGDRVLYEFEMNEYHYVRTLNRETHVVGKGTLGYNVQLELMTEELYSVFDRADDDD